MAMRCRFYQPLSAGGSVCGPCIHRHDIVEGEVRAVLAHPGEELPAFGGARMALGQIRPGERYLRVVYVLDPEPGSAFVLAAFTLRGEASGRAVCVSGGGAGTVVRGSLARHPRATRSRPACPRGSSRRGGTRSGSGGSSPTTSNWTQRPSWRRMRPRWSSWQTSRAASAAPDRGGITASGGSTALQPPRQVSLAVHAPGWRSSGKDQLVVLKTGRSVSLETPGEKNLCRPAHSQDNPAQDHSQPPLGKGQRWQTN